MSGRRHLPPGPGDKSAAWRGGAFMLGAAVLALLVDWVSGAFIEIGFSRAIILLIIAGLTVSAPYGIGWARGEHGNDEKSAPSPTQRVEGPAGSTYVIVHDPGGGKKGAPAPTVSRAVKARELGPAWYAAYTIFWRWPVLAGDAILSGIWSLVGRFVGTSPPPRADDLHTVDYSNDPPRPDRSSF